MSFLTEEEWQPTVDLIVDSVLSDKPPSAYRDAALCYEDTVTANNESWISRYSPIEYEQIIPIDTVPSPEEFQGWWPDYENELPIERIDALEEGAAPSVSELHVVLRHWLQENSAENPGYGIYSLKHSNGHQCYVLTSVIGGGPGFEEDVTGYFKSTEDARETLRKDGFIDELSDTARVDEWIEGYLKIHGINGRN